ncbi:MAG: transglycosylase domain-containing protein [Candidatus Moduliflexus flocculans]|nr:transglycosylase domain-containing protein [Candidatus Moduliflexus flocculans]
MDMGSTRVSPAAYEPSKPSAQRPSQRSHRVSRRSRLRRPSQPHPNRPTICAGMDERMGGCLARGFVVSLFGLVILAIIGGSVLMISYYRIARTLPSVDDLQHRASQFETTRILDRNGQLLYEILDPNAGRRTYVTARQDLPVPRRGDHRHRRQGLLHPPRLRPAGHHPRLVGQLRHRRDRAAAHPPSPSNWRARCCSRPKSAPSAPTRARSREIILAAEITRRYSKDEILELYLNEIYYGNLAYGIEAAAETYFGKTANQT